MNPYILVYLFFLHFVADFLLQSREMGRKKSEEPLVLIQHLIIQYTVVYFGSIWVLGWHKACLLSIVNTVVHGLIDWNIWRLYKWSVLNRLGITHMNQNAPQVVELKSEWKYWEDHWFYATIGLDQLLHISTLTILLGVLK